jgi:hypothetical protein
LILSNIQDEPDAPKAQSVFSGFAGFGKTSTFGTSSNASPFSFLSNKSSTADKVDEKPTSPAPATVHSGLTDLNKAFLKWIQSCIDKNPDCILLPIFKDYEKYVQELKKDKTPVISAPAPIFGQAAASSTLASTTTSITSNVFGSIPGEYSSNTYIC